MSRVYVAMLTAMAVLVVGCPQPPEETKGSLLFAIDLTELREAASEAKGVTITAVEVVLSRDGFDDVVASLDVTGDEATGVIEDLEEGFWHIDVEVLDGVTPLFTGETDVNIIAGEQVEAMILFDPVITPITTGSVSLVVGINPLPGYQAINQGVDQVLFDEAGQVLYLYDAGTGVVSEYEPATLNRTRDIELAQAPLSLALDFEGDAFLLGYSTGSIFEVDAATEVLTLLGNVMMGVEKLLPLSADLVLATGVTSSQSVVKTFDVSNGMTLDEVNIFQNLGGLLYNPSHGTVYSNNIGSSPADLVRIKIDTATGEIVEAHDSIYHGDFALGAPIRLINDGTRVTTSSGNMFTSEPVRMDDLVHTGSLGFGYADLASDDVNGYLYVVTGGDAPELVILDQGTFFEVNSVALQGAPFAVVDGATHVVVLTEAEGSVFGISFGKGALGL